MIDGGVRIFPGVERSGYLSVHLTEFMGSTQLQVGAGFSEVTRFSDLIPTIEHDDGPCHVSSMTGTYDPPDAPRGTRSGPDSRGDSSSTWSPIGATSPW
jgi:hypothetical protein